MRKTLLMSLTTLIILSIISIFPLHSFAATSYTMVKDEVVNPEDVLFGELQYKNETDKTETISISISSYDAKEQQVLTTKPFIGIAEKKITVKPKKTVTISYAASIPKDTPAGTYFNVVFFTKNTAKGGDGNVDINQALGMILAFHVQNSTSTVGKIFFDESDVQIAIEKKGLPYISNTVFVYRYTNNSDFVFKPTGEIRILDANEQQVLNRYELNTEGKTIYPGESFEQRVEVKLWNNITDVLSQRNIVSRTYSNIDSTPIMNKVTISILYQVAIIGGVALVILIAVLYMIFSSIAQAAKARKAK